MGTGLGTYDIMECSGHRINIISRFSDLKNISLEYQLVMIWLFEIYKKIPRYKWAWHLWRDWMLWSQNKNHQSTQWTQKHGFRLPTYQNPTFFRFSKFSHAINGCGTYDVIINITNRISDLKNMGLEYQHTIIRLFFEIFKIRKNWLRPEFDWEYH